MKDGDVLPTQSPVRSRFSPPRSSLSCMGIALVFPVCEEHLSLKVFWSQTFATGARTITSQLRGLSFPISFSIHFLKINLHVPPSCVILPFIQ